MKRLALILISISFLTACGIPHAVKHSYSPDGKTVTFQAMKLLKPVQVDVITFLVDGPITVPPQTLKIFAESGSWTYYQAQRSIPGFPVATAEGLAIHKREKRYGYWIRMGGNIQLAYQSLTDVKYEIIEITEPVG